MQSIFIFAYFLKEFKHFKELFDDTVIAAFGANFFFQIFFIPRKIETCW